MRIAVGRWDCMGADVTIEKLKSSTEDEVISEIGKEIDSYDNCHSTTDENMGIYELEEFEVSFNAVPKDRNYINSRIYWMIFF